MTSEYRSNLAGKIDDLLGVVDERVAPDLQTQENREGNDCEQSKSGQVITHLVHDWRAGRAAGRESATLHFSF